MLAQEVAKNAKTLKEQFEDSFKKMEQEKDKHKDLIEDQKLYIEELSQKLE